MFVNVQAVGSLYKLSLNDNSFSFLGEQQSHPELNSLRENYHQWLTETGQDERAGEVKERQGDFQGAINLYLRAGLPAKAARLTISRPEICNSTETVSRIAASLIKGEFYERVSGADFYLFV